MYRCILIGLFVLLPWFMEAQEQILRAGSFELFATPVDPEGNAIFSSIGQMPEYPGGLDSLYAWLLRNITYPKDAKNNNLEGTVITKFVIDTNGMVTNVSTYKSVHPKLDSVCYAAVKNMQPWSPGITEGKPERVQFLLPVRFILTCQYNCVVRIKATERNNSKLAPCFLASLSNASFSTYEWADSTGSFYFDSLHAGQYRLIMQCSGYLTLDTLVDIERCTSDFSFYVKPHSNAESKYIAHSEFNASGARRDIENNNIRILLPGGLIQETTNANDSLFEQKYHVRFISQGCVRLPGEDQHAYNQKIFNYLDKHYGRRWRREIRQDVIGLKQKK